MRSVIIILLGLFFLAACAPSQQPRSAQLHSEPRDYVWVQPYPAYGDQYNSAYGTVHNRDFLLYHAD